MNRRTLIGAALALSTGFASAADYRIETVADGLANPWSLAFLPDGGMLVTERAGRLRLIDADGALRAEPVAGVPEAFVNSQAGLMEVALAPDFAESGELFLSYSCGTLFTIARAVKGEAAQYWGDKAWTEDSASLALAVLEDAFE